MLYNPNHALSLFSTFNPDAVSTVDFYKSAFPAKYGGRLSSVMDIRMREGNAKNYHVRGGVGLIASRLSLEGPIVKDTASFIISARYSYIGLAANTFSKIDDAFRTRGSKMEKGNKVDFYDINIKLNYKLNRKNHLYLSGYLGNDQFLFNNFSSNYNLRWGNMSGSLRWNHNINSRLFVNTVLVFSQYNYQYELLQDARNFLWKSDMKHFQLKSDAEHFPGEKIKLKYGIFAGHLNTLPGKVLPANHQSQTRAFSFPRNGNNEYGAYAESDIKLFSFLLLRAGLRFTTFVEKGEKMIYMYAENNETVTDSIKYPGGKTISRFYQAEPRITLNYTLSPAFALKAAYSKVYQNLHLLSNSSVGMPTDIWMPSGKHIKPQSSGQFTFGMQSYHFDDLDISLEGYLKNIKNVIDYKDNADLFLNNKVETQILSGKSKAMGIELLIRKKTGNLTGWGSYTLSKVTNRIEGINNGEDYPAIYDKPHNLRIVTNYRFSDKWTVSLSFAYSSGSNMTLAAGTYIYQGASFVYYTKRNGYRVPAFHQLDISTSFRPGKRKKWKGEWVFAINNIYNRKNVFSIYAQQDIDNLNQTKIYKMYLYGMMPSVTYNFNF